MELVDALFEKLDVELRCTHAVYKEQVTNTLSHKLNDWQLAGRLKVEGIRGQQRRQVLNQLGKIKSMPGQNDIDLITLAQAHDVALFSHDTKASDAAKRLKILRLDVIDLAGLLVEAGGEDWEVQERRLGNLHHADWRFSLLQWRGSVEATLLSRPYWPGLLNNFRRRWLPPA